MILLGAFPIGEASNPGPDHFEDFTLGTFNPSGLRNKAEFFQAHLAFGDVWTISETHFFGKDVTRFKAALRASRSAHKYCLTDQTSMRKSLLSQSSWKGVGVLSKFPTRAIPSTLPQPILDSGRALMFASLIGDVWTTGAVMYGEPNSHLHPSFLRNNEYLLHHVAAHICNLSAGPRFLAGDWNVDQDSLPAFDILRNAGFRDVQDVALERWGWPVQHTCKGKSRKDFLYLSPELQELLVEVSVLDDIWPDHVALTCRFRSLHLSPSVWVWPMPQPFHWPEFFAEDVCWNGNGDMTEGYKNLWQDIESAAVKECQGPIPKVMLGRAQRTVPKECKPLTSIPVKQGRHGEFQPDFFGPSAKHAQWVRQTRRFQAYARLAASQKQVGVLKAESWSSILRASGFHPEFAMWWNMCEFKTSGAPVECPCFPPDEHCAKAMFDSMVLAVRNLETLLKQQSKQYAKFRRDMNPNMIFADLRSPMVPGVDVLLQPIRAKVEEIDEETGQLTLDHSCDFDARRVIACGGKPLPVIHHDSDAIWVEKLDHVQVGDTVCQTRFVGTHHELEHEFLQVWKERWLRHVDVPTERWEVIVEFSKRHLPPGNFHWPSMSAVDLRDILRHKKKTTSHGFDGVTLADLRHMPDSVLHAFCQMFKQSEATGNWPSQLIHGKVVSLAKVHAPGTPADFRPITVFSILYRAWSSFHARKALSKLEPVMPDSLYGSRPGRYAGQVWAKLLWCIEHSFHEEIDLSGLVADLQKAFNMIPRLVVFEIAAHMGLPGYMMLGWAGALAGMQRRFLLRGSFTASVPSVTGFPEGCGLSCVAMLLMDTGFHMWHHVFFPLCTPISYVDDWQLICPHSDMVAGAKRCLDAFVRAVDLQLDTRKTFTWSLTATGRSTLRQQGFSVVLSAKNLGAHVQMSRKHTNSSLMERVKSVGDLWPKMRISACRYLTKVRAILVAAWPKALHAVAATGLSDAAFHSLRTGAMKGLNMEGSGCNAWIQLGLIEHSLVDPQFWSIMQTVRCARDCGDARQIGQAMLKLVEAPGSVPTNTVTMTLLDRIQLLGWHVAPDGLVHDFLGPFSLFSACMTEVVARAQWAWQMVVAQQVDHRHGLKQLQYADVQDTRLFLKTLGAEDRELFMKCLNGCHITQDCKVHCQADGTDVCPFCMCTDSRYHRFWECDKFQTERAAVPEEVLAILPNAPDFLSGYGWSLRPHTQLEWWRALANLEIHVAAPVSNTSDVFHVFTDGSCLNQAFPSCRLAAWSVVAADPHQPSLTQVLDMGPLPGLLQSAYRAEIFALWRALSVLRLQTEQVHVWSDCGAVVRRLERLLAGHACKPNSAHSDLWCLIQVCLGDFRAGQVVVHKVAAHQRVAHAMNPLEEWCFTHNSFADQTAMHAQRMRSDGFWRLFGHHVNATIACQQVSRAVQHALLAVSRAVIRSNDDAEPDERQEVGLPPPVPAGCWQPLGELHIPQAAVRWYGDEVVRVVLSWYWQALHGSTATVRWVSQFQLYIDFMLSGESGPTNYDGWKPGRLTEHADLIAFSFLARARWFSKVLRESLRHHGTQCVFEYCRPDSRAIFLHTKCFSVPWCERRLAAVDDWLLLHARSGFHRTSKTLENLPLGSKADQFADVWLTCA